MYFKLRLYSYRVNLSTYIGICACNGEVKKDRVQVYIYSTMCINAAKMLLRVTRVLDASRFRLNSLAYDLICDGNTDFCKLTGLTPVKIKAGKVVFSVLETESLIHGPLPSNELMTKTDKVGDKASFLCLS